MKLAIILYANFKKIMEFYEIQKEENNHNFDYTNQCNKISHYANRNFITNIDFKEIEGNYREYGYRPNVNICKIYLLNLISTLLSKLHGKKQ